MVFVESGDLCGGCELWCDEDHGRGLCAIGGRDGMVDGAVDVQGCGLWEDSKTSSPLPSERLEVGTEECVAHIVGECLHIRVCVDWVSGDDVGSAEARVKCALQAGRRRAVATFRMAVHELRDLLLEGACLQGGVCGC